MKKLDELKSSFLNITSHELRTPMSSIKGYVQMIQKQTLGKITDEQNNALNVILRNCFRPDSQESPTPAYRWQVSKRPAL